MRVKTADLPSIGKKISMSTAEESKMVLIVHHTGKRELYFFENEDQEECDFGITLTADETREMGAQLLGATYQPIDMDQMKMFRNQIMIEWVELLATSQLAGKSIGESKIRTLTGASIIGVVRGSDVIAVPDISVILKPMDTLMIVGKSDQVEKLTALCKGEAV